MVPTEYAGPVVGLDISSSAVRLVQLHGGKGGLRITAFAEVPLAEGVVDMGLVVRADIASSAISQAYKHAGLSAKRATTVTALSASQVFIRQIRVPRMSEEELASALQWEAERYLPFDAADAVVSFYKPSTQAQTDGAGEAEMDVVLVASRAQVVNGFLDTLESAGVRPRVLEVSLFALPWICRCLPPDEGDAREELERRMQHQGLVEIGAAYIEVTADQSGLLVLSGEDYRLSRSIPVGTAKLLPDPSASNHPSGFDGASYESLASELRRNLDYYAKVVKGLVSKVYLCGEGAALPGLAAALEREVDAPVEVVRPLAGLSVDRSRVDKDELEQAGASMAVAIGLALRGMNQLG